MAGKCPSRQHTFFKYCNHCGEKYSPSTKDQRMCKKCLIKSKIRIRLEVMKRTLNSLISENKSIDTSFLKRIKDLVDLELKNIRVVTT